MDARPGDGAEGPLVLAVPSKGRLQEAAAAFFARAGLELIQGRGARDYRGAIAGLAGVEVAYVSSAEIVGQLAAGQAHFGVAGEDLVREKVQDVEARLALLSPLGFGQPMWWSPRQGPGSTCARWPISTTSPRPFAPGAASGCGSRPNTST